MLLILESNIEFVIHMVYEVPEQLITKSADNCRKIWNKKKGIINRLIVLRINCYLLIEYIKDWQLRLSCWISV